MPTPTARYRFEFELCAWARELALSLTGHEAALFFALRPDGSVRRVYVARHDKAFGPDQKARMTKRNPGWLHFGPYDEGGAAYLEWAGLPAHTVEQWVGRQLTAEDFLDVRGTASREAFPESWRVIVAQHD